MTLDAVSTERVKKKMKELSLVVWSVTQQWVVETEGLCSRQTGQRDMLLPKEQRSGDTAEWRVPA